MKASFEFNDNVIGILVDSELNQKQIKDILALLEERLQKHSQVSLYVEDEKNKGISFKALLKAFRFTSVHSGEIMKIAIVTDSLSYQLEAQVKDFLVSTEVKVFASEERISAMNWVMD